MNADTWLEYHNREMERLAVLHQPFKVDLPERRIGNWEVKKFEVRKGVEQLRQAMKGRPIPIGTYTRLFCHEDGDLFMSDTPAELNDARELMRRASGQVLITGLGLGMIPRALFLPERQDLFPWAPEVDRVWIIEKNPEVIKLVAASLAHLPVTIVCADAFEWLPEKGFKFDWAWHDIWPTMNDENLPEVARLRMRFRSFMKESGRQLVWGEAEMKAQRRRYG